MCSADRQRRSRSATPTRAITPSQTRLTSWRNRRAGYQGLSPQSSSQRRSAMQGSNARNRLRQCGNHRFDRGGQAGWALGLVPQVLFPASIPAIRRLRFRPMAAAPSSGRSLATIASSGFGWPASKLTCLVGLCDVQGRIPLRRPWQHVGHLSGQLGGQQSDDDVHVCGEHRPRRTEHQTRRFRVRAEILSGEVLRR